MFAHSIKGCRHLGRTCVVLIPSPCVNTTPEPFKLKVRRPRLSGFPMFSSNKLWWRLRTFSSHERRTREPCVALPPKGRLRPLATPLGTIVRELGQSISVFSLLQRSSSFFFFLIFVFLYLASDYIPIIYFIYSLNLLYSLSFLRPNSYAVMPINISCVFYQSVLLITDI